MDQQLHGLDAAARDRAHIDAAIRQVDAARTSVPAVPGYDMIEQVHAGGQGVVYAAIHKSTRRRVAIKFLRDAPAFGPHAKYRFEREVRTLAGLKHPNIVAIHDSGEAAGRFYLVMDFVEGVPLDRWIADFRLQISDLKEARRPTGNRQSEIDPVLRLFVKICEALNAAHLRGVIHRDLKPSNILVSDASADHADGADGPSRIKSAIPMVLDFGLAKITFDSDAAGTGTAGTGILSGSPSLTAPVTAPGQFVGSLPWASPEQASGEPDRIDVRTDVYALGVMLYHALSGQFPYPVVGNMADVLRHIQTTEPPSLRIRNPHASGGRPCDADLDTIVRKCLSKEPQRRYQSAGDLARDLARYLAGEAIEARRDSTWYVIGKTVRRHKGVVAAAAAFVLLLAGFGVVSAVQSRSYRALAEQRRRESYASAILAADSAFRAGDIAAMQDALIRCPEDFRNDWEWRFLRRLSDQSIATFKDRQRGHRREATCVTLSPDETVIVSGGQEGEVIGWDATSGRLLWRLETHGGSVAHVCYSADAKLLATSGRDGIARIWDAASREPLFESSGPNDRLVGLTPEGTCLLSRRGFGVVEWSPASDWETLRVSGEFDGATVSADGALIAGTRDSSLWISNPGGVREHTLDRPSSEALAIRPEGRLVAVGFRDGAVQLWDPHTGRSMLELCGHTAPIRDVTFSPDGRLLVSSSQDCSVRVWDAKTGFCARVMCGHRLDAREVCFWADGNRIVSAGADGAVKVWALSGHDPELSVNDTTDSAAALNRLLDDRAGVAGGSRTIAVRDLNLVGARFKPGPEAEEFATAAAVSPDGSCLAIGTAIGRVELREPDTRRSLCHLGAHASTVYSVVFSRDGQRLATGSADDTVCVWDVVARTPVHTLHHDPVRDDDGREEYAGVWSVAFSPDGRRLASASYDRTVRVWDVETGEPIHVLRDYGSKVLAVTFSPDGKYILAGGASDLPYTLKLWDAETGKCIRTLAGDTRDVYAVSFNLDGSRFLSGGADGTVRIWDTTGEIGGEHPLLTLRGSRETSSSGVSAAFFTPDGNRIVAGYSCHELRVWDAGRGPHAEPNTIARP